MMTNKKELDYYMNLPYKVEISPEEDGAGFNASIPDLKGCVAFGETVEEAYQTITEVKQTWIEIALERGWQIPGPIVEEFKEYSGRFNLRLPRSLHRKLAELAEAENTSLNQLVVALSAEGAERLGAQIASQKTASVAEPVSSIAETLFPTGSTAEILWLQQSGRQSFSSPNSASTPMH